MLHICCDIILFYIWASLHHYVILKIASLSGNRFYLLSCLLVCLLACLLTYLLTYFLSYLLTDATASNALKMIIKKNHLERHVKLLNEPKYLIKIDNYEYWWSMTFKTATRIPHNIPDLLVWDTDQKMC